MPVGVLAWRRHWDGPQNCWDWSSKRHGWRSASTCRPMTRCLKCFLYNVVHHPFFGCSLLWIIMWQHDANCRDQLLEGVSDDTHTLAIGALIMMENVRVVPFLGGLPQGGSAYAYLDVGGVSPVGQVLKGKGKGTRKWMCIPHTVSIQQRRI